MLTTAARVLLNEASNEIASLPLGNPDGADNARKLLEAAEVLLGIAEDEREIEEAERAFGAPQTVPVSEEPAVEPGGPLTADEAENLIRKLFPGAEIVRMDQMPGFNRDSGDECPCPNCQARREALRRAH